MKRILYRLSGVWAKTLMGLFWISTVHANTFYIAQDFQGWAEGTPAVPLCHIEGTLSNTPAITGSVSILLQFEGSGDLRALLLDQGAGVLAGLGLGAADVQVGTGFVDYATGRWSVDWAPVGMVGSFNISASYQSGISSPLEFHQVAGVESATSTNPLIKMGGGLSLATLQPETLRLILRRKSDDTVMGLFCGTGAGELVGATFLNSNLPEFSSGRLNPYNGAWIIDIPTPGLIEDFRVDAVYAAADNPSLASLNEFLGTAPVPPAAPLLRMGGELLHSHPVPGSVSLFLRSHETGRLLGFVEDSTNGMLLGNLLFASRISLSVEGGITYSTGGWFADVSMPGADENLDITASYCYSNGPPRKIVNSPQTIQGTDAAPLLSFSGKARGLPLCPGTVRGWVYQSPSNLLSGTFHDLGDGRLKGGYLFQGIVPVAIQGGIEYTTGLWSVSMTYPGLVGTCSVWVSSLPLHSLSKPWDFNGDWQSDLTVYTNGIWSAQTLAQSNLFHDINWGWSNASPIYGDYEGKGINDWAVYDRASGDWYVRSLRGSLVAWKKNWGYSGAIPVPGDYDRDGVYDYGVFGVADGRWYLLSAVGPVIGWGIQWGGAGATPVPGDYDGDGLYDLAVFDSTSGSWYVRSLVGPVLAWDKQWGWPDARVVPGDYDGDDCWDLAVFNDQTGRWYIQSLTGGVLAWGLQWGWQGAVPVTGDFDGDGTFDLAVYNHDRHRWYIVSLTAGVIAWDR
jgi:hypothetical protein